MASGGGYGEHCYVKVWDMKKRRQLCAIKHDDSVRYVKVHGDVVVSASDDHTVKLWNRSDGRLATLQHDKGCNSFDIQNNLLAVAGDDGLYIWSLKHQQTISKIELGNYVYDVRFQQQSIIAVRKKGEVYAIKIE